ncbi:MAG TPA: 4-hydroxy-tetrahydrodipicolinate reductase [Actinomycetota bacterium]|nr:4-hydroxy-tetrahydrodipicolinate reductase [Actinomycetota bacterium]
MIRVGVLGANGRMGREVCAAVEAEPDLELTEEVDVDLGSMDALVEEGVQVAVDFTNAAAAAENIPWCIKNGIHVVVGTSGLPPDSVQEIRELAPKCEGNVLIAPNFAIGAVLAMKFSEIAAAWMPDAEVIELHHSGKMDSPSGTALQTVEGILRGRRTQPAKQPGTLKENLPGARGAEKEGVHVHSVRLPGLVAHQEVIFGGPGQILTIRHDSIDRKSFMPGVILGIRRIADHPGLTVGLEHYLGL